MFCLLLLFVSFIWSLLFLLFQVCLLFLINIHLTPLVIPDVEVALWLNLGCGNFNQTNRDCFQKLIILVVKVTPSLKIIIVGTQIKCSNMQKDILLVYVYVLFSAVEQA